MTWARKASAKRSASTRASPLPATLTSASSRSSAIAFHRQVDDVVHRHQAFELALDLFDHHGRAGGHDGDAGEMLGVLGLRDRQGVDIVAAPGKQPDDPGQNARLVVDEHGHGVLFNDFSFGLFELSLFIAVLGNLRPASGQLLRAWPSDEDLALFRDRAVDIFARGLVAEEHVVMGFARRDHREAIGQLGDMTVEDHRPVDDRSSP